MNIHDTDENSLVHFWNSCEKNFPYNDMKHNFHDLDTFYVVDVHFTKRTISQRKCDSCNIMLYMCF